MPCTGFSGLQGVTGDFRALGPGGVTLYNLTDVARPQASKAESMNPTVHAAFSR